MLDFLHHKKAVETKESSNEELGQKVRDANTILSILRNSYCSMDIGFQQIYFLMGKSEGLPYNNVTGRFQSDVLEERVLDALRFLVEKRVIGFGGNRGNSIIFCKSQLPSVIV